MFIPYLDINHDSSVSMYLIEPNSISVIFKNTPNYVYTYTSKTVGDDFLQQLKNSALVGTGLNSLITRNCRDSRTFIKTSRN